MDTIYDTLAKLNKVANAPEIVKEDSNALLKKGLKDFISKGLGKSGYDKAAADASKMNQMYKPFGKDDKDYEDGLSKDAKKDKMFDDMAAADAAKMNKASTYTPFSDKQSPDGLPEKKKDGKMFEGPGGQSKHELIRQLFKTHFGQPQWNELTGGRSGMRRLKIGTMGDMPDTSDFEKAIGRAGLSGDVRVKQAKDGSYITVLYPDQFRMQALEEADLVEKESDVKRDDRAEKAGREVAHDAKYDGRRHAGKDGKSVTKDIEYDEKHDKDGMHEADINEISNKTIDSYMDKVGQEPGHEKDMETPSSKRGKGIDLATAKQLGNAKVKATENAGTLKDAARQGVMARLAELAGIPAQEIEEALGTPQDIADKIMSEDPLEEDSTDRSSVTLDMVAPALKKLHKGYKEKADEYHTAYAEMEADGMSDEEIMDAGDDIIDYVKIDDIEDKIRAIEEVFKEGNFGEVDGNSIIAMASSGETAMRELFMQELKSAIKQDHPEVYTKLFMYESEVEEGNEFSGERDKAIKAGKNDFTVGDKTYPVKGDKNESLEESDIDQIADVGKVYSKINKMKMDLVDDGMEPEDAQDKACEKYDCDPSMYDKYVEMKRDEREGTKKESKELDEGAVKDMMQDVEEGMDKKEFEKKYPGQDYDGIKKDIEDRMDEEKVEETTSGSVATSEGAGKPLYQNASVYESNEIVKRAMQLNEDMSVTVSAGTDAEPNININASGEDAAKMAELCKLAGIGMMGMGSQPQSPYGEVEIQVAEDQEFANGADDQNTMDTEYMTQDIAGGLNGPKKMAYPKVAGGDNPMARLSESELNEVSANNLMKLYQEYKAK